MLNDVTWLQIQYCNQSANFLDKFRVIRQNPYTANFRCNYCSDSKKNRNKARGYVYEDDKHRLWFTCHNCGEHKRFSDFLRDINPTAYSEYLYEVIKQNHVKNESTETQYQPQIEKFSTQRFQEFGPLQQLPSISQLPADHPAKKYVLDRLIPNEYHPKLFYAKTFNKWVNSLEEGKFSDKALEHDEPRLIIPLIDQKGYVFGFQGRSFRSGDNVLRYITIMLDKDKPKVFGLDTLNQNRTFYVLEGPIDSMFVDNACAMVGADVQYDIFNTDKMVVVFDNQPRNLDVVKRIQKAIDMGLHVVVWSNLNTWKDVNDMVVKGKMSPNDIMASININTYKGLHAQIKLNDWKRV